MRASVYLFLKQLNGQIKKLKSVRSKSVRALTVVTITCVLLAGSAVGAVAKESPDARRDFQRAVELAKVGKESEALVSLTDFLRRYPESSRAVEAQLLMGEIEFRRRNFETAINELKKTLKYKEHQKIFVAEAYYLIGECWMRMNRYDRALIEWRALIRKFQGTPAADKAELKIPEVKALLESTNGRQQQGEGL